jgi:hypothetical protein
MTSKPPFRRLARPAGIALFTAALLGCAATRARADDPTTRPVPAGVGAADAPVSRQEYDHLAKEVADLRQQHADDQKAADDTADDVDKQLKNLKHLIGGALPGTEQVLIVGDAAVGFTAQRGSHSSFFAGVSPLILWQPVDRLLFEAGFDAAVQTDPVSGSSTSVDLSIANASFLVNDYLAVGGGLFVVPFGVYHNHFDPPWINKFPDDPLAFSDGGIAPDSEVGVYARGAIPVGPTKVTYDVYGTNGPRLNVGDGSTAGQLSFDDYTDLDNGKAAGGRIGFLPAPNIEVGYSVQYSTPHPDGFGQHVSALLQCVDANWRQDVDAVSGTFDTRAEWVFSDVSRATYDPSGKAGFGPLTFTNYREGGYVQLCYRPTKVQNKYIQRLELCTRYDRLTSPIASPGGEHEQRFTVSLDYWLEPNAVLKVAYEVDQKRVGEDQNALLVQFGIGL